MSANFGPGGGSAQPGSQPIQPQKKSSGWLKGCLIAAGVVAILIVLVAGIGGWYGIKHGGEWFAKALELGRPEFLAQLGADFTPEQRAEVEQTYDQMVAAFKQEGFIQIMTKHEKSFRLFQAITIDKKITPDEARLWIDAWTEESGSAPVEAAPPEPAPAPEPGGTAQETQPAAPGETPPAP